MGKKTRLRYLREDRQHELNIQTSRVRIPLHSREMISACIVRFACMRSAQTIARQQSAKMRHSTFKSTSPTIVLPYNLHQELQCSIFRR